MKLEEKLVKYSQSGYLPMHMPGHKRNVELLGSSLPYEKDITEIDGFDDLHHPETILKDIEDKAKELYGSDRSFLLVNGSTCGILTGIYSATSFGDSVLVARGCHKSVYHAIEIRNLNPIYLMPRVDQYGIDQGVFVEDVVDALNKHQDIKLIVLTSPTYEGIISNIYDVVKVAHECNIPVLVDEAHGAHLNFDSQLAKYSALESGADIVIQSLHKTLPSLTQTALLHIQGKLVEEAEVSRALSIFETSSPSYVLMSSIDNCLSLIEDKGHDLFRQYESNLQWFYNQTKELKKLVILGNRLHSFYDYGKIVILVKDTNISGLELANILRKQYKIEVEMSSIYYVIAMSSVCDSRQNFERLFDALKEIDFTLSFCSRRSLEFMSIIPQKKMNVFKAIDNLESDFCSIFDAAGKTSQEYLWVYPPGVPFIVPGEIIDIEIIKKIDEYQSVGIEIRSTYNKFPKIKCF